MSFQISIISINMLIQAETLYNNTKSEKLYLQRLKL